MSDPTVSREARLEKTKRALEDLDVGRADGLRRLELVQEVQSEGLVRERARIAAKYGERHPRVVAVEDRLQYTDRALADLAAEIEKTEIEVPDVNRETWLVHGRVVDETNIGLAGLTVSLSSESARKGRTVASAKTDERGYFAIRSKADVGTAMLTLSVTDANGNLLHVGTDRLTPMAGGITYRDITIVEGEEPGPGPDPDDPDPGDPDPGDPDGKRPPDGWLAYGEVLRADGSPAAGMTVSLYDKDLFFDDVLGTTVTAADGTFHILYRTEAFRHLFDKKPDLYISVLDDKGKVQFRSEGSVRAEAGVSERFEVVLPT